MSGEPIFAFRLEFYPESFPGSCQRFVQNRKSRQRTDGQSDGLFAEAVPFQSSKVCVLEAQFHVGCPELLAFQPCDPHFCRSAQGLQSATRKVAGEATSNA